MGEAHSGRLETMPHERIAPQPIRKADPQMLTVTAFSGGSTIRWKRGDASVLLGFISGDKFRAAHPSLDACDGARWGDNIRGQIETIMKGETHEHSRKD